MTGSGTKDGVLSRVSMKKPNTMHTLIPPGPSQVGNGFPCVTLKAQCCCTEEKSRRSVGRLGGWRRGGGLTRRAQTTAEVTPRSSRRYPAGRDASSVSRCWPLSEETCKSLRVRNTGRFAPRFFFSHPPSSATSAASRRPLNNERAARPRRNPLHQFPLSPRQPSAVPVEKKNHLTPGVIR